MGEKLRALTDDDQDMSLAMVMDMEGRVLYASDKALENTVLTDPAAKAALAARRPLVHSYSNEKGGHFEKSIPLMSVENKQLGVFRVALKEKAVSQQVRSLLLSSLLVAFICFAAATLLVYVIVDRSISRPITEQVTIASSMAAGDLSREIRVRGRVGDRDPWVSHQHHVVKSPGDARQNKTDRGQVSVKPWPS